MSGWYQGAPNRLDRTLWTLKRALEATFYATLIVALACLILLIALGTYGILHEGDDFGRLGGGRSTDVVVPALLR